MALSGEVSGTLVHGHAKNTLPLRRPHFMLRIGSRTLVWIFQRQGVPCRRFRDGGGVGSFCTRVGCNLTGNLELFSMSMDQTTLLKDNAYSLLWIFNIATPAIYGEGNRAVGRLLV